MHCVLSRLGRVLRFCEVLRQPGEIGEAGGEPSRRSQVPPGKMQTQAALRVRQLRAGCEQHGSQRAGVSAGLGGSLSALQHLRQQLRVVRRQPRRLAVVAAGVAQQVELAVRRR